MVSKTPWSTDQVVSVALAGSDQPTVATVGETLHLIWTYNRMLYHAWRSGDVWSQPIQVAIGEQPVLAATANGQLHCLFVNRFLRNDEIYHVAWDGQSWTLPVNVSLTYGASCQPVLAVAGDGTLHAAWADTTPGYSTIYYGVRGATFWANRPVPSGRGITPALAVAPDGTIYIAWADRRRDTGAYDVFCSIYRDNVWFPPESVSDSAQANSHCPQLAIDGRGVCHMIWSEECGDVYHVFYAERRPTGWSRPADLSQAAVEPRLARLVSNPAGFVHVIWSDTWSLTHRVKATAPDATWRANEPITSDTLEVTDLSPTLSGARILRVVWAGYDQMNNRRLFYAEREPFLRFNIFMPIISR